MDPLKLPPVPSRTCASCGAALTDAQEWCLQCGGAAPGSLARERDWRPLAALAAAGAILLAGAGTAAYAALNQKPVKSPPHVLIAQQVTPPTTTPGAGTPGSSPGTVPPTTTTPGGAFNQGSSRLGGTTGAIKPPKLPAVVPTPRSNPTNTIAPVHPGPTALLPTNPRTTSKTTPKTTTPTGGEEGTPQPQAPNPILLDTDAASTYNPSGYPASAFGDPGLTIDGETGTGWTAAVDPAAAPRMAEGVALDLKTARKLGSLEIETVTPGLTVEVYGANGHTLPAAITDPAWTKLRTASVLRKKKETLKLHTAGKAFRFVVVWLIRAPATSTGQAPGVVSLNELVLFPPRS